MSKKVGDTIIDKKKNEWVIVRIYEHNTHYDYELRNKTTGQSGDFREMKNSPRQIPILAAGRLIDFITL